MLLEFGKHDMKGVRITHKNDYVDDIDPVVQLCIVNGEVIVDNTYHKYTTPLSQVSHIEVYDRVLHCDEGAEDISWYEDENFETIWENK